jgi:uncharacterized RDD family membrane protein YckC
MDSIEILTGQNVTIEYKPADIGQRILAAILDNIFMILYGLTLFFVFVNLDTMSLRRFGMSEETVWILVSIASLPLLGYHLIFETATSGQTPGKIIMKIKVTNADGTITGIGGYFLRWLIRPVDMFFYGGLGLLLIIFTKRHQRLGDMAAGTVVVKVAPKEAGMNNELYNFGNNYQPSYPQVEKLSEGQIKLINDILEIPERVDDYNDYNEERLNELSDKVKSVLEIHSRDTGRQFLEKIAKDYNYYASLGF